MVFVDKKQKKLQCFMIDPLEFQSWRPEKDFIDQEPEYLGLITGNEHVPDREKIPFAANYADGNIVLITLDENTENSFVQHLAAKPCHFALSAQSCIHLVAEQTENVVISTETSVLMCAMSDWKPIWTVEGEVDGSVIDPHGITSRNANCIYVADGKNKRVLEFTGDGQYKQTLLSADVHGLGCVYGLKWLKDSSTLVVLHVDKDKKMLIEKFYLP